MKIEIYIFLIFLLIFISVLISLTAIAFFHHKIPWKRIWKLKWWLLIIIATITFPLAVQFLIDLKNYTTEPLPSDQEMIDHFYAYKEEFEALVESAREYDEYWGGKPHIKNLRDITGVDIIIGGSGEPDSDPHARDEEDFPTLGVADSGYNAKQRKEYSNKYNRKVLIVKMKNKEKYYKNYYFNGKLNWKDYIYFHDERSVENNRIKWRKKGYEWPQYRVLLSLDNVETFRIWHSMKKMHSLTSQKWEKTECVARLITPHWFLRRCRRD